MKRFSRLVALFLLLAIMAGVSGGCVQIGTRQPLATVTLSDGIVFTIRLYYDKAPNTVKNFISLAESGFYDGVEIHRVVEYSLIQMGDPDGTGTGNAGYYIKGEFPDNGYSKNDLSHTAGMVSMARHGSDEDDKDYYDTASCQFFVTVADKSYQYDGKYCVFGKILSGYDELEELSHTKVDDSKKPVDSVYIESITIEKYGESYGEPSTIKIKE